MFDENLYGRKAPLQGILHNAVCFRIIHFHAPALPMENNC